MRPSLPHIVAQPADLLPLCSKINNAGIFVLGYTQALRPGVKASFGVALDTQKLNEVSAAGTGVSAHKVGTSLVFEAVSVPFTFWTRAAIDSRPTSTVSGSTNPIQMGTRSAAG